MRREAVDGTTYLYGDRHRWTKMATLLTHTGLVLFLVAAAVTSRLGDEQGLVVAEGESLTVQPIGTPGLLLVRNLGFEAPGFEAGKATDFTTRLAVYQDGKQVADKTIRVNDPLSVGGYTFHQNGFGPAPDVVIRDEAGKPLWTGPIPMTDEAAGFPFAEFAVPGRDVALQLLLQRATDGTGIVLILPFRSLGTNADGSPNVVGLEPVALARGESAAPEGTDFSLELRGFSDYTLLIAKKDPGQGIVWVAFASLIVGIVISFWLPRRRVWGRLDRDGRLSLVLRADRYVDAGREFGRLLDDLVAVAPGLIAAGRIADSGPLGTARSGSASTPETVADRLPQYHGGPVVHPCRPPHFGSYTSSRQESHVRSSDGHRGHRHTQGRPDHRLHGARRRGDLRRVRLPRDGPARSTSPSRSSAGCGGPSTASSRSMR